MSNLDGQSPASQGGKGGQKESLSSALDNTNVAFNQWRVAEIEALCGNKHWISVVLVRQHHDVKQRPAWWPKLKDQHYAWELFDADTTKGKKSAALDGNGRVRYEYLPAGTCQFKFTDFYGEIERFFKDTLGG